MNSPSIAPSTHWLPSPSNGQKSTDNEILQQIDVLCLGTGRFLRSVLVPALVGAGLKPALIQPRGRSFLEHMIQNESSDNRGTFLVDTVEVSGETSTIQVPCFGAFSLGNDNDKHALVEALPNMNRISVLGIGVTENGLSSKDTSAVIDLYQLLHFFHVLIKDGTWKFSQNHKISIINMDNVPNNGELIQSYMHVHATEDSAMKRFLKERVVFCNTMVDRITSHRPTNPLIPKCEPTSSKALVILDPLESLPSLLKQQPGVVIRATKEQLDLDIALKLRIANGTHTAIAHALVLSKFLNTDMLSTSQEIGTKSVMKYIDSLVEKQIIPAICRSNKLSGASLVNQGSYIEVYNDWRKRLMHPFFGLSSFFITQNGPAKGGMRWGDTIIDLIHSDQPIQASFAFAYAVLLRWMTPIANSSGIVHKGWMDGIDPSTLEKEMLKEGVPYADRLEYNLDQGWYEYKFDLRDENGRHLVDYLYNCRNKQPSACQEAVSAYLLHPHGGKLDCSGEKLEDLVATISLFYARFLAGDTVLSVLKELVEKRINGIGLETPCSEVCTAVKILLLSHKSGRPLHYKPQCIPDSSALLNVPIDSASVTAVVTSEVQSVVAIDLHTHLLPPTHGPLCLWGIDELLTYHYLVAEYFVTAPASMTPELFYSKTKQEQADFVWKALFVDRLPISEACRGVITTLTSLGLGSKVETRDLSSIREFYKPYRKDGTAGAERFCEEVFVRAGIEYSIMTNITFDPNELLYWKPKRADYSNRFRSALRVDPLLAGDKETIEAALKSSGYDCTLQGARQYLRDWAKTMEPEYMMASTPHDFILPEGTLSGADAKQSVNPDALQEPFSFVPAISGAGGNCLPADEDAPSVIDEYSDFLSQVLMPVCEELDLPIALKIGAHRAVNPALKAAGDGVVAFADAGMLARLCTRFPKVRFLATFLSRNNQHEACVLASKFRNLHLYGCWWFCNNPSIIEEITQMRIELLGTAFTAQHSDARVLDQLLYKWPHARAVIAKVLSAEVSKLMTSGCTMISRKQIRQEIHRLFKLSYEDFMAKSLV